MTPDFNLWVEGQMITGLIRNRLVSIRITDEAGITSDTVEVCLDDRDLNYQEQSQNFKCPLVIKKPAWFPWVFISLMKSRLRTLLKR